MKSQVKKLPDDVRFLISREDLLQHIKETENVLKKSIAKHQAKDQFYQKRLIEKYIEYQTDLQTLKDMVTKLHGKRGRTALSKIANIDEASAQTDTNSNTEEWDLVKITEELEALEQEFSDFVKTHAFTKP